MDTYQRPAALQALVTRLTNPGAAAPDAASLFRRFAPVENADVLSPVSSLAPRAIADETASSIVSQAASILDEEMARGVLAAAGRSIGGSASRPLDAANPVLRQVHELVDSLAAMWPAAPGLPALHLPSPSGSQEAESCAEVRPQATVQAGQRATIAMALRNSEGRAVRLVPVATDLLGSRGGRIAANLLQCTPSEVELAPQEQRDITIVATVPADAVPGCYSGVLVVKGVDYLRALITIDVV